MDKAKYIAFEYMGTETIVVFPCWLNHANVARDLCPNKDLRLSAGRVDFYLEDGKLNIQCYGSSTSLNLSSRPEDAKLVRSQLIERTGF